jgi:high-affinity iron transporter
VASTAAARPTEITFGPTTCAPNWQPPGPGRHRFTVMNHSPKIATVYLFRSDSGAIVGTISNLAPGQTRVLTASVQANQFYSWGCELNGAPRHLSDSEKVPNSNLVGGPGKQVIPVTDSELIGPLSAYRRYATRLIVKLKRQVTGLASAAASRNGAKARHDWLRAHMTWLDIGQDDGAYGAFGNLGRQIDGTAEGRVGGVSSSKFTGFHRVELDLWTDHNLHAADADSQKLRALVAKLAATNLKSELPGNTAGLLNFTLRIHEVMEDALRDSLSGHDNYGSDTDLASLTADVAATREFLGLFAPLLTPRSPYLVATARRQLKLLAGTLASVRHDGTWIGIHRLDRSTREHVDGEADAVLETLAPAPDLLHIGAS